MNSRTRVSRSKRFDEQLEKVPSYIKDKVLFWIFSVELKGLSQVSRSRGLHDEPLKGSRNGQRSVRMNRSYRLIYRMLEGWVHIELLEVHKHDY